MEANRFTIKYSDTNTSSDVIYDLMYRKSYYSSLFLANLFKLIKV